MTRREPRPRWHWLIGFAVLLSYPCRQLASRPIREKLLDSELPLWEDEWSLRPLVSEIVETTDLSNLKIFPSNISGTYKGTWEVARNSSSSRFPDLQKNSGNIIFQLKTSSTARPEVHYVHGEVVLRDGMYISDGDVHMKLEGVYLRPFGHLRMVLSSSAGADSTEVDEESAANGYQLELHDSSKRGQGSPDHTAVVEMARNCKIRMITHVSPAVWEWRNGVQEHVPRIGGSELLAESKGGRGGMGGMGGVGESWEADAALVAAEDPVGRRGAMGGGEEEGEADESGAPCFATLRINATAVDLEAYYNKAVNYTLMVTFISFLQVLFIIRQMEHSNTQSGAAKVSMLMVGQQAIMDAYLCLLHLTAGIVVGAESLFNAFATAAFFKFVIFSIFEMRYLLAIWKARRPAQSSESWDLMRRELSILYSRFYGFLLGGILLIYRFSTALRYLLLLFYSFWIPQIVTSVIRDSRKPLHVHYILGMSATRLAIPLYIFGCPKNFMRVEPSPAWCAALIAFMGAQVAALLLQHYLGPRWFIPKQFLPEKYSYFRRVSCLMRQSSDADDSGPADCVICMTPVPITSHSMDRMVTPCDHMFHTACLQRWMDIKMECPTCRRCLPPV
ncbi:unnamed protein product [Closterium sp. Naga37s-1]|nr:unnamed protein product [Closterium sp. Naga37s-1]